MLEFLSGSYLGIFEMMINLAIRFGAVAALYLAHVLGVI